MATMIPAVVLIACCGCGEGGREVAEELDYTNPDIPGSDIVIAEVNGVPITAGYVQNKISVQYREMTQTGPGMAEQVREVLKRVIDERCFNTLAYERGWDSDPEYRRVMELSSSHILMNVAVSRAVTLRARPSEEEIRAFYENHPGQFGMEAQAWYHHILLDSEAEAWSLYRRLQEGEEFEDLAKEFSRDTNSAKNGGEMPPMTPTARAGSLGNLPEVWQALGEMEKGGISEPVLSEKGWHILRLDAYREEQPKPYEEVRTKIGARMTTKRGGELFHEVLDSLKQAYRVKTFEEALDRFYFLQMDDAGLFEAAQRQPEPEKKLAMYEQILERYPESVHCPEALFMVGFVSAEEAADTLRAMDAFEHFLQKYPDHEMASSARLMIQDLGGTAGEEVDE
jgi:peptidyl-prolyl cis-trans isomerase C